MAVTEEKMGEVWRFPASAFAAVAIAAVVPESPWGPTSWPTAGPFGAFTWTAWFVSTGLGITLLFLAAGLTARRSRPDRVGRAVSAGLMFGMLAALAYLAAASAEAIEKNPAGALVVALAGLVGLRGVAARLSQATPETE